MNPEAKEVLETILGKDKATLNQSEVEFLRARRDYLNDEQKKRFADVLEGGDAGPTSLSDMTVAALKQLAADNEVDIAGLSKKDEIVAKLTDAGITA